MEPLTRDTLIQRIAVANDPAAWGEFCAIYQPLVRAYVTRFRVQEHDADDLVQATFAKLHEQMPGFQLDHGRGRFRGWLRSLTDNTVRDWLRAKQRQERRGAAADPQELDRWFADTETDDQRRRLEWQRSVLDLVLRQVREEFARREKVLACFEQLTMQGRPAKDVAAAMEIDSVNTVYVYAHRVLQRVRELCAEYDEEVSLAGA
jgi:RNA polymerase sigma-70 factor (ECF subfamily)